MPPAHDARSAQSAGNDDLAATIVRPALPRYVLRGISGAGFGRTFPLLGPTTLGRAPDCGILLDHPGLSRHHARLTPTEEGLLVEDLGSTNGCLLNDARVQRGWARHGDEIGLDALRFRVVMPGQAELEPTAARGTAGGAGRRARSRTWGWMVSAAVLALAAVWALAQRL